MRGALLLLVVGALALSGCGREEKAATPKAANADAARVLAMVEDVPITEEHFQDFLDRARPPDHRIGSLQEAFRLLQACAREILLVRRAGASGPVADDDWRALREAFVEARLGPVEIAPEEVDAYLGRHGSLLAGRVATEPERAEVARLLRERRIERLSRALLEDEVARVLREIDRERLRTFVSPVPTDSPPVPPGFPDGRGSARQGS